MINRQINMLSGIAIILIILSHLNIGNARFISGPFAFLGITLFTFISGFKFIINHKFEALDRTFLRAYFGKRFNRLYKPYVGYTLLMLIPLYAAYILSNHIPVLREFKGLMVFDTDIPYLIYRFLTGDNPIVQHTWYLFSLLIITAIFFCILYITAANKQLFIIILLTVLIILFTQCFWLFSLFLAYLAGALFAYYDRTFSIPFIKVIETCGKNSFQIYLLHEPIIEPLLLLTFVRTLPTPILPLVVVTTTILFSVALYNLTKKLKINKVFE